MTQSSLRSAGAHAIPVSIKATLTDETLDRIGKAIQNELAKGVELSHVLIVCIATHEKATLSHIEDLIGPIDWANASSSGIIVQAVDRSEVLLKPKFKQAGLKGMVTNSRMKVGKDDTVSVVIFVGSDVCEVAEFLSGTNSIICH